MNETDARSFSSVLPDEKPEKHLDWHFSGKPARVLFLSSYNGARSQMAEALLRHLSQNQVEAYSAGSQPATQVHPLAVRALSRLGARKGHYAPKNLDRFREQTFDRVVVLCDPAQEVCPAFPGRSPVISWTIPDPRREQGTEQEQARAFDRLAIELNTRIRLLLTLLEREQRESE